MRRTDEAFKTEVFRRYRVQKQNRRNYFLLALSPLVLAIVLGSLLFLPQLSELLSISPAGTTTTTKENEKNPNDPEIDTLSPSFQDCLKTPAQEITALSVPLHSGADRLQKALQDLHYTEIDAFKTPSSAAMSIRIEFPDSESLQLLFFHEGRISAYSSNPDQEWYFQISQEELSALKQLVDELIEENTVSLATLVMSSDAITQIQFMNPDFSQTTLSTSDPEEIQAFVKVLEMIEVVPSESFLQKPSGITLTFHYDSGASVEMIAGDFLWCKGIYFIAHDDVKLLSNCTTELISRHLPSLKAPAPESYLYSEYTAIDVEQMDFYSDATASRTVRINELSEFNTHLQTALKQASLITEKPPHYSAAVYWIEMSREKSLCVRMIVDRGSNLLIVAIVNPEEAQNVYYFTLPEDVREDLCTYLDSLFGGEAPPVTEPLDPPVIPDPNEYLPENYTEVWVYNGTLGHRRSQIHTLPLLKILREKLSSAQTSYDPIPNLAYWKIQIKADELSTYLLLDFDANLIIVSIEEDPNNYYFSLSEEDMAEILVGINNFIDEIIPKPDPPVTEPVDPPAPPQTNPIYPTPGNLCTEVHPTADHMRLFSEYLSPYDSVFDSATINEVMQMLHSLQLTETSTTPEYVFNQRIVNLWFTGYDYYIILDDKDGWVRTFLYADDEATLLEAKLYKGDPAEIAKITAYLANYNRNPWVDSLQPAPLSTFRTFLKQSVASVELAPYVHFSLPFESTDPTVIAAVIQEILSMNLIDQKEGFSADYYDDSSYVNIQFANGSRASLFFNTTGYVEYRLHDEKAGVDYVGRYHLPASEVKSFEKFIEPYLRTAPSGNTPLIEELSGNAALQSFLTGVGVSVKGSPEDAPLDIQRILTNYNNTAKFFACELSYTSPDGIVLEYLLYDYGGIDRSPLTDEERRGLVKAGVHPESLNFDVSRYTLAEIRSLLEDTLAYMPAFTENLHEELIKCTTYVPETDCYYQFHSDSLGYVVGVNARMYRTNRTDTVIVLFSDYYYGGLQVAAFRMVNGEYRLYGYTPI